MRRIPVTALLLLLPAAACNREEPVVVKDSQGIITAKPYAWKTPISENNLDAIAVRNNIKHQNTVVVGSIANGQSGITAIDVATGEKRWTWQDRFPYYTLDIWDSYNQRYLFWDEERNLYCVDLANGQTVWKERYVSGEAPLIRGIDGTGEDLFVLADYFPYIESDPRFVRIYRTSVTRGPALEEIVRLVSDSAGISHAAAQLAVFPGQDGSTLVFVNSYDYDPSVIGTIERAFFSLYNVSQNKWVYRFKELPRKLTGFAKPKLHNGLVYIAMNPYMVAADLMSGEVVWERHLGERAQFYNSGFILVPEKNLVIINAEASGTILYALDMVTGNIVWQEPSSGTSSRLQYLNGVIYFVGGGDGLLHAVDVDTGRHLWKIRSPDEAVNSNAWFARYCAAFPGQKGQKGRIVVTSGLNAFAYEAVR